MSAKRASVFMQSAGPPSTSFENPRKSGFMTKHGGQGFKASWRKRYFVLDSGYLFYYASENEKKPLGIVCLADYCECRRVSSEDPKNITKKHPNMIMLKAAATSDPSAVTRDYFMYTETEEEVSTWISAVTEEISTAQHDDSLLNKSGVHRKEAPDGNVLSKSKKMTKDDQKSFDEITKRAGESSVLQHITASRPRPVGRRKPRKYQTYDEDDETGLTTSCAPRMNQSEVESPVSLADKRTQSSPGKNRALLPKKGAPLLPSGAGSKAGQPTEASKESPRSNGPPPLPSGRKPSAESSAEAPQSNGPPPLPSKKPSSEASTEAPQSNGPPPLPSKKPSSEASTEAPQSNGPPPPPSSKKPSAEAGTETPQSNGPPPVPSGKPKRTTEPTEEPKSKVADDTPVAQKDSDGSSPVPQKTLKQMADHGMESEDADGVIEPKKGPPPPLPTKEKPSKLQPTPPPEIQAKKPTKSTEQPSSAVEKNQLVTQSPTLEPVAGSSPKLAPKPSTAAYKPRLSPAILPKRSSAEHRTAASPTTKAKAELPLPKPRNRASVGEEAVSAQQQQQTSLPKPVPKPRTRSSSGMKLEGESPTPTSPMGIPEEGATTPTSTTTPPLVAKVEKNKPSTPTSPTPPQVVARVEKDKPSTPTSVTTPPLAAKAEKGKPATPTSPTPPQVVARVEKDKPSTPTSVTAPPLAAKVEDKPSTPTSPTPPQLAAKEEKDKLSTPTSVTAPPLAAKVEDKLSTPTSSTPPQLAAKEGKDKPSTPTSVTAPPLVAKAEKDKPSTPTSPTPPQVVARVEKDKPSTPTSVTAPPLAAKVEDKPSTPTSSTPPQLAAKEGKDKLSTPTSVTTPPLAAKAQKDKPPTPTLPTIPQSTAKVDKDESSTDTLAATTGPVSPATEPIEVTPSSTLTATKGPNIDTPESAPEGETSKKSDLEGPQEDKSAESPQRQPPVDAVVDDAPPTVAMEAPPTSQEATTKEELGVSNSHPPSGETEGEEGKNGEDSGSDDETDKMASYDVPRSWVRMEATGLNEEPPVDSTPIDAASTSTTAQQGGAPKEDVCEQQYEPFELPPQSDAASASATAQQGGPKEDSQDHYEPFELPADQKREHAAAASEICESAYGLVDASLDNEAKQKGEEEGDVYANEGADDNEDSNDSDDVYEAMVVPEEELIEKIGYVKMKSGGTMNALTQSVTTAPPRKGRNEQGYDNVRLRSSPYANRDVKSVAVSLPRDRDMRQTRSGHSSTSTEYEMVPGTSKEEIEGLVNEFDFYPDTPSLNLEQAREVLRLARIARKEAEEMRRKARQELELAERERKDGELIKRNALEILRMAKEKLEHK